MFLASARRVALAITTITASSASSSKIDSAGARCASAFVTAAPASLTTPSSSTARTMSSAESSGTPGRYDISPNLRGLFAGSGVEGLSNPLLNAQILGLLPPDKRSDPALIRVLYLGTATYDLPLFREKQTGRFVDRGCRVSWLDVADAARHVDVAACARSIEAADVILVGGGNTLFAVDRFFDTGLVSHLQAAMERGCVLAGGSAGAICWFESGHSDSADPDSYRVPMLAKFGGESAAAAKDERSEYDQADKKEWKYLRCPGLGFVPGPLVCCPHHDKIQSNGVLRAHDFDGMLLARARANSRSALGLGIDHYAAFIVEGERYRVYALPDKPGSVATEGGTGGGAAFDVGEDGTPNGVPGVWIKRVLVDPDAGANTDGELFVEAMVCPPSGMLADILAYGGDNLPDHNDSEKDENQRAVDNCRKENPSGRQLL